ncbi:acyl-CoA dehydrogenase family protein [Halorubrum vacuolatum]|uniref:Acyl-CoA dehydrogenase n=1 Tax=Halorubrum vacuolatum TaxID=63740 RepID=A0A238W5Q5_HALVU|nr:acyl-CoA dehydrogenase family protein [Halorubrum vacuolatum]SNR41866.1 Acyl-CoA dehydrogenase [Halorubrum vacuolatum]
MEFTLTAEQRQMRDVVADFVDEEVVPRAAAIDETDEFPADLIAEMADLGLMGMPFPEEYGGAGLDYHAYAACLAEISRGSGGLGTVVAAHTSLAGNMVYAFGDETQRETYLSPLNRGEDIGAFALSEAGAGSDVAAMTTTAEPDGDGYVLSGGKLWTSNGSVADTVIVFAKTDTAAGHRGISAFIVRPGEDDGFVVEGTEKKLGDKGCPTAELRFDDLRLPSDRLLGEEGEGFVQALKTLNGGRITIAARSVGIARAAFEAARTYATEREQFGGPISDFQAISHKLADMDTKIQAATLLMHKAADLKERDEPFIKEAAQAKLYASEISREVANEGIQIHGGYGYTKDFPAERFYRDAKLSEIYEGTSEVLRNTIAQQLLDE